MQINKISFGKIVKVNASYETAKQIEDIANGVKKGSATLNRETKALFSDISKGWAYTFKYDNFSSYIFSGEEGQKYWDSCSDAIDKIRTVKENTADNEQREKRVNSIWEKHLKYVYDLINNCGIFKTLDPMLSKSNKVKALNISG